jgi:hypothetical protein
LWRGSDLAVLLVLNACALVVLALAWSAVRGKTSLADQASLVALAIGGLVAGAVGDAYFLLAAKSSVAGRAAVLLRPGSARPTNGAGLVAIVVPLPGAFTGAPEPVAARPVNRLGWCRLYGDRLFAVVAGGAGLAVLLAGWVGLSTVVVDHRQVPWVVGASFLGLWLLGLAGTAWLGAVLRDQWATLGRIAGRLGQLGVESVAEIPAPIRRSDRSELRGADGIPSLL